jgi:hypothetical protein
MYVSYVKSISLINRQFHFDLGTGNNYHVFLKLNNYSFDGTGVVIFNYTNFAFPTLSSHNKTVTQVFSGYESIMNFRTLNAIVFKTSGNVNINIKGVPETEKIIKNIFDHLPDYFASFEEETEE